MSLLSPRKLSPTTASACLTELGKTNRPLRRSSYSDRRSDDSSIPCERRVRRLRVSCDLMRRTFLPCRLVAFASLSWKMISKIQLLGRGHGFKADVEVIVIE